MNEVKQVLVTGGAQRLGAELCREFSAMGWSVWCHYQKSQSEAEELAKSLENARAPVRTIRANLSVSHEIDQMMASIERASGPLSAIVNNASLFEPDFGTNIDLDAARAQINVNLLAPMYLGQCLERHLKKFEDSDACLIHILDQKVFNLNPAYFSYTLSKLALERAIALQAQSLAPRIRVCGVAPGLMYLSGPQSLANFKIASKINLLKKATNPCDVAKTCFFLASTPSITGTTLCVDNGQHLVPLKNDVMFVVEDFLRDFSDDQN